MKKYGRGAGPRQVCWQPRPPSPSLQQARAALDDGEYLFPRYGFDLDEKLVTADGSTALVSLKP